MDPPARTLEEPQNQPDILPLETIRTYRFCHRKAYLEEVLLHNPGTRRKLRRSILTEAYRYTNLTEQGLIQSIKEYASLNKVEDLYYHNARRALQEAILNHKDQLAAEGLSIIATSKRLWPEIAALVAVRARHTQEFLAKHQVYGPELWWGITPKISLHVELRSPTLGVNAVVPMLESYDHGVIPCLLARQEAPPEGIWSAEQVELGVLMLLLAELGLIVQEGKVLYHGETRSIEMSPELASQVQTSIRNVRETLESTRVPDRTDHIKKCERCPHREKCYDDAFIAARWAELF